MKKRSEESKVYYGKETKKALENFQISSLHVQKNLIYSTLLIKKYAKFI